MQALKGRDISAWGNALGLQCVTSVLKIYKEKIIHHIYDILYPLLKRAMIS